MILVEHDAGTFDDLVETFESLGVSDDTEFHMVGLECMKMTWKTIRGSQGSTGNLKGWGWCHDHYTGKVAIKMLQLFHVQDRRHENARLLGGEERG